MTWKILFFGGKVRLNTVNQVAQLQKERGRQWGLTITPCLGIAHTIPPNNTNINRIFVSIEFH